MRITKAHVTWFFRVGYKIRNRAELEITNGEMMAIEEEFEELLCELDDYEAVADLGFGIRHSSAEDFDARLQDLWSNLPYYLRPARRSLVSASDKDYVNNLIGE